MDATLALGDRDTLDAVNAALEFQFCIRRVAFDGKYDFLVAAAVVGGFAEEFGFVAVRFAPAQIHPVEFCGK